MDNVLFERNLKCLAEKDPALCERLRRADTTVKRYSLSESRSGEQVPAIIDSSGAARPLHSSVDPRREAMRIIESLYDSSGWLTAGFLVFTGLGGGFVAEAALRYPELSNEVIIDYDAAGIAELLHMRDYTLILGDPRCTLLIDPSPAEIEECISGLYLPSLCGDMRLIPLRSRIAHDQRRFDEADEAIVNAIKKTAADYSVQAHFGLRWFSNIIRNLKTMGSMPPDSAYWNFVAHNIQEIAVCAAGPSLDSQIPLLAERKQKNSRLFILAADTSLPALLCHGLRPDAVLSIDCQHISYYHFIGLRCRDIPLFLDIASPPLLARLSDNPVFVCGGHPLGRYSSANWRHIPAIDTSGGNVGSACLSLASNLGARHITVYGADFSYPQGKMYARGTYIFPFFEKKQNRCQPLESLFSTFLYRVPFLAPEGNSNYYETASLRSYRKHFEEQARSLPARVSAEAGLGPPLRLEAATAGTPALADTVTRNCRQKLSANEFLREYRTLLENLPLPSVGDSAYTRALTPDERQILATLLPLTATLKYIHPVLNGAGLIDAAVQYCAARIEKNCS